VAGLGGLYQGRPLPIKTRKELLATIRPNHRKFLPADTGELPDDMPEEAPTASRAVCPVVHLIAQLAGGLAVRCDRPRTTRRIVVKR
jgi:hypothetical protein